MYIPSRILQRLRAKFRWILQNLQNNAHSESQVSSPHSIKHKLPDHIRKQLEVIEHSQCSDRSNAIKGLRSLGLGDFVIALAVMPHEDYPRLSNLLPQMVSADITNQWTGADPMEVMKQGVSFARACSESYININNTSLDGKRILDFACGYGRFVRIFSYYSDHVQGVDAWPESIDIASRSGLKDDVFLSDEVPASLPVDGPFDFISAFSIFTHLSKEATLASLKALRATTYAGGVLAITIRPIEYWEQSINSHHSVVGNRSPQGKEQLLSKLVADHVLTGFSFIPAKFSKSGAYGDSSMTIEWLDRNAAGWRVAKIDSSADDPSQRYVFLVASA